MSEQNDETADGCEMLTATSDPVVLYQALCGATREIEQLERERDQARQKIERQAERIRYLEGATNHATGTPLSQALKERDKARSECARLRETIAELLHEPPLKITLKSKP